MAIVAVAFAGGASAQSVEAIDPNQAINAELGASTATRPALTTRRRWGRSLGDDSGASREPAPAQPGSPALPRGATQQAATYHKDDLIGAAEGRVRQRRRGPCADDRGPAEEAGEPNGYIVGREAGGAFVVGLRYGSGTLHHKSKAGSRFTGPGSVGFDAGANAGNTFVLVYNLYDSDELYKRFPRAKGRPTCSAVQCELPAPGDVVLIPVRMGVGLRLVSTPAT
jgi:hypothetical protein